MCRKCKVLELTLSENCNLSCVYCYEHCKNQSSMSIDLAKKLIKDFFYKNKSAEEVRIGFHGGEVLLQFDTVRSICEWLWSQDWKISYICKTLTNGTLMRGEIAEWFQKNRQRFRVQLSYDGTPEMQDVNRTDSSKDIDLSFFKRNWPEEWIKMTVSPHTIGRLFEGVTFLHRHNFNVICNLAYWIEWPLSFVSIYQEQLRLLADWYLSNPQVPIATVLALPIDRIAVAQQEGDVYYGWKWCGCGESDAFYAPDGKRYPCQGFMPSVQGCDLNALGVDLNMLTDKQFFKDEICSECKLYPACGTCCAENLAIRGALSNRCRSMCNFRKVEIAEASRMYAKMLGQPEKYPVISKMSKEKRCLLAKGLLIALSGTSGVIPQEECEI